MDALFALLCSDDSFIQVHFDSLLQRSVTALHVHAGRIDRTQRVDSYSHVLCCCSVRSFPFHSPSFPMHGLDCLLVLQGCLALRPDLDPKRRAEIVAHFVGVVQQQQQRASTNGHSSTAQAPSRKHSSAGRKGSRRNDSDCVIS